VNGFNNNVNPAFHVATLCDAIPLVPAAPWRTATYAII
jgi:hypothetical protein